MPTPEIRIVVKTCHYIYVNKCVTGVTSILESCHMQGHERFVCVHKQSLIRTTAVQAERRIKVKINRGVSIIFWGHVGKYKICMLLSQNDYINALWAQIRCIGAMAS